MIEEHRSGAWSPDLSNPEKETLFEIAQDSLAWCVADSGSAFLFDRYTVTETLKVPTATFVTLKKAGALRGCIGSLAPEAAMFESVHTNAVNAAMNDFRFPSVRADELPLLDVHISLLSPIESIAGLEAFRVGEHGIILSKSGRRAVFLPEVAVEQGWTKADTVTHLSMKAGLPADAWREGAAFQVFSSVVLMRA